MAYSDGYERRHKVRTVRVPDDVWEHAQRCAQAEGTTVSARIVQALRDWEPATPQPEPDD